MRRAINSKSLVALTLMKLVYLSGPLRLIVAAQWMTMSMLATMNSSSAPDRPIFGSTQSPLMGNTFSMNSGCSSLSRVNSCKNRLLMLFIATAEHHTLLRVSNESTYEKYSPTNLTFRVGEFGGLCFFSA